MQQSSLARLLEQKDKIKKETPHKWKPKAALGLCSMQDVPSNAKDDGDGGGDDDEETIIWKLDEA